MRLAGGEGQVTVEELQHQRHELLLRAAIKNFFRNGLK
jgi:hypothetical protein